MPPRIARLAGLGAFAAAGGIALLYALFVFATRPTSASGLDGTERFIAWFTVAGVVVALIVVHVVIGRQLMEIGKGR